ncbi:MAG: hypothetical protein WCA20_30255 [Candidatus Sulfotelmatobacter sp.]
MADCALTTAQNGDDEAYDWRRLESLAMNENERTGVGIIPDPAQGGQYARDEA